MGVAAPQIIIDLVERFKDNIESYKAGQYNETQARREFIDPFFEALGWDINNKQGFAEAYKDVIHEDSIKIGGFTKAPDYSFRIGGVRKFFVEAKKPSVYIKEDVQPAFQLRRYAWSAKLPVSILTDFEEFAVYDCRKKPVKTDKASNARIIYFTFRDYAEKWDEIAGIFSREAILKGAFDKFVSSNKAKGTAEVDEEFLREIEGWRDSLARNIALRNNLSAREINFAVQKIIDRIIFLRIAEDRGIEIYGQLQALSNGHNTYKRLVEIFYKADDRYNSGIFHFQEEKGEAEAPDLLTPKITVDDQAIKDIVNGLYYPESAYEFSVLPADILGQVYEQFLGKVIRLTSENRIKIEEKPEVKKAGGVFYTPTYIVEYIVKATVGSLIKDKTPKQIEKIRVLDPACGSGSFLIGAYQCLLDYHLRWYVKDDPKNWIKGKNPALYQGSMGDWRLTTSEKKKILLNNIFGVDIDTQAVEVTKLSLLLKVLEGESEQTINRQLKLFHERALPNLGNNIKCGNSLIGPEFFTESKTTFDNEFFYQINTFDWKKEFFKIFSDGGFDAVIGNPPYVVIGNDIFQETISQFLRKYEVAQYKADLFHLFIQKGTELLKVGGKFGFIVPNTWLTLQFTDKLRKYVLEKNTIREIVLFNHRVFQKADVHTAIILFDRLPSKAKHQVLIKQPLDARTAEEIHTLVGTNALQSDWIKNSGFIIETRTTEEPGKLAQRILKKWPKLEMVARASLGCQAYNSSKHTKEQIAERVFHSDEKLGKEYLPELAGKDVGRYEFEKKRGKWIKYGPWLHDYRTMDWLQGPRILIREITGAWPYRINACYLEETYCNYKTILNVNPSEKTKVSMKYILGILNSKLISFVYPFVCNKIVAKSFPRVSVRDLKQLPIRNLVLEKKTDKEKHEEMVRLVEQRLQMQEKANQSKMPEEREMFSRQTKNLDEQIDRAVYALYELSKEEIDLIEGQPTV